ncbi:MAG: polyketide cyclase [Clostridium butyricum]|nr:polyketide cyclase [Clostridium butyricum]
MKKCVVKARFISDIKKVWEVVTNNSNYAWRSDLSKIEICKDNLSFIEYTSKGFLTNFIITEKKPFERYEFDISNKNMKGHWSGIFNKIENGTEVEFIEEVSVNNPIMNLFVGAYLKKQQKLYIKDLKKALGE